MRILVVCASLVMLCAAPVMGTVFMAYQILVVRPMWCADVSMNEKTLSVRSGEMMSKGPVGDAALRTSKLSMELVGSSTVHCTNVEYGYTGVTLVMVVSIT